MKLDFSLLSKPKQFSRVPGVPRVPESANPINTRDCGNSTLGHEACPTCVPGVPILSRQPGTNGGGSALGHVGHDWDTPRVPPPKAGKTLSGADSEGLGHAGHVGHEKSTGIQYARDTETGAPFAPYCVPMSAARVAAMLAEIREAIDTLADTERWPADHRAHLLALVARQPAFTLADDLTYFRERLASLRAAAGAAEAVENLVRTCSTCAHRQEFDYGVRVRCAMARALSWRHRDWLDAPDGPNSCGLHERRE